MFLQCFKLYFQDRYWDDFIDPLGRFLFRKFRFRLQNPKFEKKRKKNPTLLKKMSILEGYRIIIAGVQNILVLCELLQNVLDFV